MFQLKYVAVLLAAILSDIFVESKVIYNEFNITHATVAPNCVTKTVATINGGYPGPTIYATSGDRIVTKVCNNIYHGVSIHWHGMHMRGEQWMDGPAFGVQCPIQRGQCFTYNFSTSDQHGTYWYHAHIGLLRASVYGALIISPKKNAIVPFPKPAGEFVLLLNDWYHKYNADLEHGLFGIPWSFIGSPDSFLINGRGLYYCKQYSCPYANNPRKCGTCDRSSPFCNPLSTFVVEQNKTYRFRLVNVGLWAQMNFAIENHKFKIVMADGYYLKETEYDSIDINPGQAFDLLVTFDQDPKNYWIAINGRYDNLGMDPPGLGVIKYKGNKWFEQPQPYTAFPTGPDYLDLEFGPQQQYKFKSFYPYPDLKTRKVDKYFSIMWTMNQIDGYIRYAVNNNSFYRSTTPMLAAEYYNISRAWDERNVLPGNFTPPGNATGLQPANFATSFLQVEKGDFVQVVLQNHNPPGGHHPWHLHGIDFWVVGHGDGFYDASKEKEYEKTYNLVDPPKRSMVTVYQDTFAVIRFEADNVGVWNFHCHMEPHIEIGMQIYLRVKGKPGDIPPPPKDLRRCGKLKKLNITDDGGVDTKSKLN